MEQGELVCEIVNKHRVILSTMYLRMKKKGPEQPSRVAFSPLAMTLSAVPLTLSTDMDMPLKCRSGYEEAN